MHLFTRSFLLFVAILLMAELAARFVFVRAMEGRFDYGYHPTAGFVEKSDGEVELHRSGGRRFFPQTFQKTRPEGVYRVMVIGDSVSRGKSVEQSYTGFLEKELQARGIQAECLNLSLPGFGARRKDLVIQQAEKYQPNLIILHVGTSNEYEDEREWQRRDDFNSPHPKNWLMHSMVLRQFYEMKTEKLYWQWLPRAVRSQAGVFDVNEELRASTDENTLREWKARVKQVTAQALERLHKAGIPTLLVLQASNTRQKTADGGVLLSDVAVADWTAPLVRDGVARISMKEVISPVQAAKMYTDSNHVKPEGHRLIAQAIAQTLSEKGWLPKAAQK